MNTSSGNTLEPDAEPVPLSALQHWSYCPRQCGLIHLEQSFADNVHTLRGHAVHAIVDTPGVETRAGVRVERALPVFHDVLCLVGKCDVVEFAADCTPYPVEYKQGSRHKAALIAHCDDIQLAGQAMCLEAMLGRKVPSGAIYYAKSKRRRDVTIDAALRAEVTVTAEAVRAMLQTGCLPPPTEDLSRCRECSLRDMCQPELTMSAVIADALSTLFDPDE